MTITKALLAGLFAVSVCMAQTVTISGKVTDSTGVTPISGAAVRLEMGGLSTTSGSDGSFTITGTVGIITTNFNKTLSGKITATLRDGYMSLSLREKSEVEISSYTIQGKELSSLHKTFAVGSHSVALPITAAGVCLYRIRAGKEEFVLKSNSLTGVTRGAALSNQGASPTALTRQVERYAPFNDVIKVEKAGYLNRRVTVTNSDTSGMVIQMILQDAGTVTDIDGNVYHAIRIGNQVWTVENLRVTKYNDGSAIPLVTEELAWSFLSTPGYCYFDNTSNTDSIKKWGALYNAYVASPTNSKKIAPAGWHVPTDEEWTILKKYLVLNGYNWDGTTDTSAKDKIAKSLASKTDWNESTIDGAIGNDLTKNNGSGFSAFPVGYRGDNGTFYNLGKFGSWWSSTDNAAGSAWYRFLGWEADRIFRSYTTSGSGFSLRLVRDN